MVKESQGRSVQKVEYPGLGTPEVPALTLSTLLYLWEDTKEAVTAAEGQITTE